MLNAGDTITTTQTIFVYAGTAGCSDENSFTVTISGSPTADAPANVTECSSYTLPALSANNNYFTATNGGGTMLNAGDAITTTQTIFVYAGTAGCSDENSFTVTISGSPTADAPADVTECSSYILPALSANNNYFTAAGGGGTMLSAGTEITTSTMLFVYAGAPGCSDERVFNITISSAITVDVIPDQTVCASFILPAIANGNYYTESLGLGTELFAGEEITSTQTLFIYLDMNGCEDESSFTVTIDESICDDPPPPPTETNAAIPSFFTPNGDGINDFWNIPAELNQPSTTVFIYDRYGQLLKQIAPNASQGWDGTFLGRSLPSTDYWYKIVNEDTGATQTGHFSLKR